MDVKRWSAEPVEQLSPMVGRQAVHSEKMTIARVLLRQGAYVPRHEHVHEQVANVLEGRVRFGVGETHYEVGAGESLVLPPSVPHDAEALEDSVVLDVFCPIREDWLRGEDAYLRG